MKVFIDHIVARVENESAFVEKSGYTIETLKIVLAEELQRPTASLAIERVMSALGNPAIVLSHEERRQGWIAIEALLQRDCDRRRIDIGDQNDR